ncbi:Uncharacterized membrane protein [Chitinophaga costaii]|uniref:Uncharacterized membrane protein n=1 Tax=Chitinophaga costaii TaxID=1335309 RepID=A0A1C4EJB4_9BACT|nr:DUF4126 family protein [Chitinophaga costaii]PUZ23788.1 DUF4126 domain-containing protein [Chitinophaga costaii]SCC43572.1 Uncharacterized membrane protein [Chitinophaga costaii]
MSKLTFADIFTIAGIGVVAGSRALLAPALVSRKLQQQKDLALHQPHKSIRFNKASVWTVLSAGELVGDKLPMAKDRILPMSLVGRGISGGLAGAQVGHQLKQKAWVGALIGSATALGATYLLWYARTRLTKHTKVPDTVAGLAEDAMVFCLGHKVLQRL